MGASGFLGWHVCKRPPKDWRLVGAYHGNPAGIYPKTEALQLDLTNRDEVWRCFKSTNPDAVLHLAAASNPAHCEANPETARLLNVEATTWLAAFCEERRCKLLFTSSSQVYDGGNAPFSESPTPSPKNAYGRQKLEAEGLVAELLPSAAVIRVAVMYGMAGPGNQNFLNQWLNAWRRGKEVTAFYDEIRSFLSGSSAADGLSLLLEKGAEGVFNLGGAAAISRYDFARMASEIFALPAAKIIRKSQQEVELSSFRPPDLTMDLRKITDLGFVPQQPLDGLKALVI